MGDECRSRDWSGVQARRPKDCEKVDCNGGRSRNGRQRQAMVGCGNGIFNGLEISRDRADAKAPIRIDKACRGVQKLHKVYKLSWLLGRHSELFWSANKAHKAVHSYLRLDSQSDQHSRVSSTAQPFVDRKAFIIFSPSSPCPLLVHLAHLRQPRHHPYSKLPVHAPQPSRSCIPMPSRTPFALVATRTSPRPSRHRPVMLPMP